MLFCKGSSNICIWEICALGHLYPGKQYCTYLHTFLGSISVSQRQSGTEQVINTQMYTIFTNSLQDSFTNHPYK